MFKHLCRYLITLGKMKWTPSGDACASQTGTLTKALIQTQKIVDDSISMRESISKKNSRSDDNQKGLTVLQNYKTHERPEQLGKGDVNQAVAAGEKEIITQKNGAIRQRNTHW